MNGESLHWCDHDSTEPVSLLLVMLWVESFQKNTDFMKEKKYAFSIECEARFCDITRVEI